MSDLSTSIVRYLSGLAVGVVVALLARFGLGDLSPQVTGLVAMGVAALYGTVARIAEKKFPQLGWLLGKPSPTYAKPVAPVAAPSAPTK